MTEISLPTLNIDVRQRKEKIDPTNDENVKHFSGESNFPCAVLSALRAFHQHLEHLKLTCRRKSERMRARVKRKLQH